LQKYEIVCNESLKEEENGKNSTNRIICKKTCNYYITMKDWPIISDYDCMIVRLLLHETQAMPQKNDGDGKPLCIINKSKSCNVRNHKLSEGHKNIKKELIVLASQI